MMNKAEHEVIEPTGATEATQINGTGDDARSHRNQDCQDEDGHQDLSEEALSDADAHSEDSPQAVQPDSENDSMETLLEQLNEANEQIEEMKSGFLRAKADVENIRRRSQNEIVSARKFAIEGFAQELLSVKDSLDQATKVELDQTQGEAVTRMKEGLELTLRQLETVFGKFSVTEVDAAPGVKFNPEFHQAISIVPGGEIEPDHIVDVMQKGFVLKDRLLRPAMVIVAQPE